MPIPTELAAARYEGDGATSVYPFDFYIQEEGDLAVWVETDEYVLTQLEIGTDYEVSGAGDENGGTITLLGDYENLTDEWKLAILLKPELNSGADFRSSTGVLRADVEDAMDRTSLRHVRQQDEIDRCIRIRPTEAGGEDWFLPPIALRAGKALGFDADGYITVGSDFVGISDPATISGLTVTDLTASRLVGTSAGQALASVSLASFLTGTSNQITAADNGSGGVTLTLSATLVAPGTVTVPGLAASRLVATTAGSALTTTALSAFLSGTSNQITIADDGDGTATASLPAAVILPGTLAFSSTITGTGSHADTSGTKNVLSIAPTFAPTTGTGDFRVLSLTPTLNSTGGTGRASILHLDATVTDAFAGNMAALSIGPTFSGGATGVNGGIWVYGADNGTTTWEAMRVFWHGGNNSYYITSEHQNSVARKITLGVGGAAGTRYEVASTYFGPTSSQDNTLNLGDAGNRWAAVYAATHVGQRGLYNSCVFAYDGNLGQGSYYREAMRGIVFAINGVGLGSFASISGTSGLLMGYESVVGWLNADADSGTTLAAGLYLYATDQIIQRRSTNAQNFYVANTWTSATVLEAGVFGWTGDLLRVGTFKGGSGGTARDMAFVTDGTTRITLAAAGASLTFAAGVNLVFDGTTGSKIGNTSTDKLALWGATPIVQPAGIADSAVDLTELTGKFNSLLAKLEAMGALAVA